MMSRPSWSSQIIRIFSFTLVTTLSFAARADECVRTRPELKRSVQIQAALDGREAFGIFEDESGSTIEILPSGAAFLTLPGKRAIALAASICLLRDQSVAILVNGRSFPLSAPRSFMPKNKSRSGQGALR